MDTVTRKINDFLRHRKCQMSSFEEFRASQLYEHYANIFGDLIYTEDTSIDFIALGKDGWIYDEMYYPQFVEKKGVIIPKIFHESDLKPCTPDPIWKGVAENGYAIIRNVDVGEDLREAIMDEAFIPHGFHLEKNMPQSVMHPYFYTLMDYERPELHKSPDYMKRITEKGLTFVPQGQPIINSHVLTTSDAIKYVYDKTDMESIKGPYSFHHDYYNRQLYMFFLYFSKHTPIVGRELLVGKQDDYSNFAVEGMELAEAEQPTTPTAYEKVSDEKVPNPHTIFIENNMIVLMNTFNPMFVHKVCKLREKNEVTLVCNYLWSKDRPKTD